jgi:hypothetical protein
VIHSLSRRFADILADFQYPKLTGALIDDNLMPQVRELNYSAASSGGLVLISLAYHLAIWEIAFEQGAAAPGVLVIDSPQKNLGHAADDISETKGWTTVSALLAFSQLTNDNMTETGHRPLRLPSFWLRY